MAVVTAQQEVVVTSEGDKELTDDEPGFRGTFFPALTDGASELFLGAFLRKWPSSRPVRLADFALRVFAYYFGVACLGVVGLAWSINFIVEKAKSKLRPKEKESKAGGS